MSKIKGYLEQLDEAAEKAGLTSYQNARARGYSPRTHADGTIVYERELPVSMKHAIIEWLDERIEHEPDEEHMKALMMLRADLMREF